VLFQDGQNVFSPGGPFGSWDADLIAAHETAQGRMRESILVAIPNGNAYGSDRLHEYTPTGDTVGPYLGNFYLGRGAAYAAYLVQDVLPALRARFRILGEPQHVVVAGSSMGGLAADYVSFLHSDRIGVAGIFSPAYWAARNWVAARDAGPRLPVRRYIYMGTQESSTGESSSDVYWRGAIAAYDKYLRDGHAVNDELMFEGGLGASHNEAAWSRRLPGFFAFALDPWREAQPLALELFPPTLEISASAARPTAARLSFLSLLGMHQELEQSSDMVTWRSGTVSKPQLPWETATFDVDYPAQGGMFWRLRTAMP
jgi:predicted alpha/beta superfamily hydrolase